MRGIPCLAGIGFAGDVGGPMKPMRLDFCGDRFVQWHTWIVSVGLPIVVNSS